MKTLIQIWKTALMIALMVTSVTIFAQSQKETVFTEDWEGDWLTNWHVDAGTWEVGTPTSGPDSAYTGQKCAATVLAGNYSEPVDSRLIRHTSFVVPSASQNPRLRFWHWYSFSSGDYGVVQISIDGGSSWESISASYTSTGSGVWTYPLIDLSAYAGSTVQIAFYFHSHQVGYYGNVSTGWYIDDVEVITGQIVFNNPEDFESGIGDWAAERGTWEVGEPTSGPGNAYSGQNCVATRLDGNYAEPVDSRLISPSFIVPSASQNPRLRFWHWYSLSSGDYGKVQISVNGGNWEDVFSNYTNTGSGVWTYPFIDLSAFSDSTVQIAFYFHSHQVGYYGNVSTGWYIDDIEVITGQIVFNNPEDFELGIGDWAAERGTWEVGEPTSGPGDAYSGQNCVATRLDGNYAEPVDSRLISPPFIVPSASQNPRLRFWHWYSLSSGDYGKVQISVNGGNWQDIFSNYTSTGSGVWTYPLIDLSAFADSMVQIAFYFHSHQVGYYGNVSTGWYIDDIEVITGQIVFNNPEDFELGIGDWAAERGTWEVGEPTAGPDSAYSPPNCAGTVLGGKYAEPVDSRIIMPSFLVPSSGQNPALLFWHWYSFSSGDYGEVQIKVEEGPWQPISNQFISTSSNTWTPFYVSLLPYADSIVHIAFYFHSHQVGYYGNVSTGWYIDDIRIEGLITGVIEYQNLTSNDNMLSQNFPNPFAHQTNIQYSILNDENVRLSIYNINGQLIKMLVNERQKRGNYSVTWQGKNEQNTRLSPGIYFYELKTENKLIRKKMLLLK